MDREEDFSPSIKRAAYGRQDGVCAWCGVKLRPPGSSNLDKNSQGYAHHYNPIGFYGKGTLENCVYLCYNHHLLIGHGMAPEGIDQQGGSSRSKVFILQKEFQFWYGIETPPENVLRNFKNKICKKTIYPRSTEIYRVVTNAVEIKVNGVNVEIRKGNQFLKGNYWFDRITINRVISELKSQSTVSSRFTDVVRQKLSIAHEFNEEADRMLCVTLNKDMWGWEGITAPQIDKLKNGRTRILPGGYKQIWIPKMDSLSATYKFYHSI